MRWGGGGSCALCGACLLALHPQKEAQQLPEPPAGTPPTLSLCVPSFGWKPEGHFLWLLQISARLLGEAGRTSLGLDAGKIRGGVSAGDVQTGTRAFIWGCAAFHRSHQLKNLRAAREPPTEVKPLPVWSGLSGLHPRKGRVLSGKQRRERQGHLGFIVTRLFLSSELHVQYEAAPCGSRCHHRMKHTVSNPLIPRHG